MKKVLVILSVLMLSISVFSQTSNTVKAIVKHNKKFYEQDPSKYFFFYRVENYVKMIGGDTIIVFLDEQHVPYYKIIYKEKIGYVLSNSFRIIEEKSSEIMLLPSTTDNFSQYENIKQLSQFKSLTLSLNEAHKTTKIGLGMFVGGAITSIAGYIIMANSETGEDAAMYAGIALVIVGGLSTIVSIPVMVIGNKRATEVLFQMIQHDQQNITSMGIGMRKTF